MQSVIVGGLCQGNHLQWCLGHKVSTHTILLHIAKLSTNALIHSPQAIFESASFPTASLN